MSVNQCDTDYANKYNILVYMFLHCTFIKMERKV